VPLEEEVRRWYQVITVADRRKETVWAKLVACLREPVLNQQTGDQMASQLQVAVTHGEVGAMRELSHKLKLRGVAEDSPNAMGWALKVAIAKLQELVSAAEDRLQSAAEGRNPTKVTDELTKSKALLSSSIVAGWERVQQALQLLLDAQCDVRDPSTVALTSAVATTCAQLQASCSRSMHSSRQWRPRPLGTAKGKAVAATARSTATA
jgi:hypothetical protein